MCWKGRADRAKDDDVREALNIQASMLGLKIVRLRRGLTEDAPEAEPEPESAPLPPPSAEQLEQAEKLIQRAALEKRRGNNQQSTDLLKQAADIAPGAATVLEALGDDLMDRGNYAAAHEAYRSAHRADPTNVGIERKYALISSSTVRTMSVEDQLRLGVDSPFVRPEETMASPKVARILSFFIPGSGQLVLGYPRKGLAIFLVWLVSASLFFLAGYLGGKGSPIPSWAYFPLAVAVVTWIVGIYDSNSGQKGAEKKATVNRPTPPVNMPFE